jgi:hypothetical protein
VFCDFCPLSHTSSMEETKTDGTGTGNAIDLSHHLSSEARDRVANPLKDILRVISECPVTDLISMANGNLLSIVLKCNRTMVFQVILTIRCIRSGKLCMKYHPCKAHPIQSLRGVTTTATPPRPYAHTKIRSVHCPFEMPSRTAGPPDFDSAERRSPTSQT